MRKSCCSCGQDKRFSDFHKNSKRKDGLQSYCKECKSQMQRSNSAHKVASAKYRAANTVVCSIRSIASQKKKPDHYAKKQRVWVVDNAIRVSEIRKRSYENNRATEIWRVRSRKHRVEAGYSRLSPAYQAEIDGFYVFCRVFSGFQVDHILPINGKKVSGLHVPYNLQILTRSENARKGAKVIGENHG